MIFREIAKKLLTMNTFALITEGKTDQIVIEEIHDRNIVLDNDE